MLGLSELRETRVYQEALEEGRQEGRQEGKLEAKLEVVPLLLELGLSVEQIAQRLSLEVEIINSVIQPPPEAI
jgi:predicted transposase/invertase (TIGR01784 family)